MNSRTHWRAWLRASLRLTRVVMHFVGGLLTVALRYPFCDDPEKLTLKRRWSARLLHVLGISLKVVGELPRNGLVVSNHISFTDVFAINACLPCSFVAKDDVRRWPLIGWLAKNTDTLFLDRGSRRAAQRAQLEMVEHLRAGKHIAVFPEGTTSNGDCMLPFHSALFQSAIDAAVDVRPIAICYTDGAGARSHAAAYIDEMTLLDCFWSIACADGIAVTVTLLPSLHAGDGDRRHLSARAHHAISHHLNQLH